MRVWTLSVLAAGAAFAPPARAQQFTPPAAPVAPITGTRIGLYGFGVRGGWDVTHGGQLITGATLDVGDLFSPRVRLRPSAELGVFNGSNTFTEENQTAIPYVGAGLALASHDGCGPDPRCPSLWVNLVLGFELNYRSTFNWLLEYHGMDAMRRHRLYIGLTTRRGG
jgi:hypothetical protein